MFGQNAEPSLRITMKIIETIGNYQHLQISGFKIVPLVAENEFVAENERSTSTDVIGAYLYLGRFDGLIDTGILQCSTSRDKDRKSVV